MRSVKNTSNGEASALGAYLEARLKTGSTERSLFVSTAGTAPAYNTVKAVFLQLLRSAGLDCPPGLKRPRMHDLRHTFAVRSLEQCWCSRDALARHVVALSTVVHGIHPLLTPPIQKGST